MKILFITRKYPPITGGMENYSYNLIKHFKKINPETYFIANPKGNKNLPLFILPTYKKALNLIKKHNITHVHICDGLLAPLGNRLKSKTGVKTSITIHGLDITFKNQLYQKFIPKQISKIDKIIVISNYTKKECIKKGISSDKITIIPNGVDLDEFFIDNSFKKIKQSLEERIKVNLQHKKILFTSGRLIKRKGVQWFIENVMPKLSEKYVYLVSGDGKEKINIEKSIKDNNLQNQVFLLERTDLSTLKLLYNASDYFIMPNIHIEGDVEGFGIVAIEASSTGLPVIASSVDGITNAVINGKTGWLVKEKSPSEFIQAIETPSLSRKEVRNYTALNYDWKIITQKYMQEISR